MTPLMNKIAAWATCLGCIACEVDEVECGRIIVHHSVDSDVIHYSSPRIFPARRVNYTRQCTQGIDTPESLGGLSEADGLEKSVGFIRAIVGVCDNVGGINDSHATFGYAV